MGVLAFVNTLWAALPTETTLVFVLQPYGRQTTVGGRLFQLVSLLSIVETGDSQPSPSSGSPLWQHRRVALEYDHAATTPASVAHLDSRRPPRRCRISWLAGGCTPSAEEATGGLQRGKLSTACCRGRRAIAPSTVAGRHALQQAHRATRCCGLPDSASARWCQPVIVGAGVARGA